MAELKYKSFRAPTSNPGIGRLPSLPVEIITDTQGFKKMLDYLEHNFQDFYLAKATRFDNENYRLVVRNVHNSIPSVTEGLLRKLAREIHQD